MATVNPFDSKTALLAKHTQHVVLTHCSIGLFITAAADLLAQWMKRRGLAQAACYNLLAAISTVPVTGLLAWQVQLEGPRVVGTFPRATPDCLLAELSFCV
jgi:uncharacterized membrane protein